MFLILLLILSATGVFIAIVKSKLVLPYVAIGLAMVSFLTILVQLMVLGGVFNTVIDDNGFPFLVTGDYVAMWIFWWHFKNEKYFEILDTIDQHGKPENVSRETTKKFVTASQHEKWIPVK